MIMTETMAKIAMNKSLLKEYDGRIVYLENGNEFQIQLFNPNTEPIAASISINNEELKNLIVIRPGERIWLERYLDKLKKFKFETYEVEDNVTTEKAIANNGVVKVRFYEKKSNPVTIKDCSNDYIINDNLKYYNNKWSTIKSCDTYVEYNSINTSSSGICINDAISTITCSISGDSSGNSATIKANSITDKGIPSNYASAQLSTSNNIETGRISEGSYSSQLFNSTNDEYNSWWSKEEVIKILPLSRKPYTSNDLEKIYCTECGRKLKTKFKYCPFCGTKIDL